MSKTAVITGATSGIGEAFAKRLAADGYDLIITGRRKEIIDKVAEDITKEYNVNVDVIIAELSDDEDIQKVIDAIKTTDDIEMLINNAAYAGGMIDCLDIELTEHERMIKVHQIVPMRLIYAALPAMVKKENGSIINVSSMGVYMQAPKTYVYCATKSFLKFFSEGLYQELMSKGIKVQALCPALINTDLYRNVSKDDRNIMFRKGRTFTMTPEATVDYSLKCLKKNKPICLPGFTNRFMVVLFQMMPRRLFYKLAGKMIETQSKE